MHRASQEGSIAAELHLPRGREFLCKFHYHRKCIAKYAKRKSFNHELQLLPPSSPCFYEVGPWIIHLAQVETEVTYEVCGFSMVRVIWVLVDFSLLASFLRRSESISIGTKESKRASKQVVGPKTVVIGVNVAVFSRPRHAEEADHNVTQEVGA